MHSEPDAAPPIVCSLDAGELQGRLAEIATAESRCCAFMGFDLREQGDELVMKISAPVGAEPVLDDLVAAFSAGACS
jgi:hypothetical protein